MADFAARVSVNGAHKIFFSGPGGGAKKTTIPGLIARPPDLNRKNSP